MCDHVTNRYKMAAKGRHANTPPHHLCCSGRSSPRRAASSPGPRLDLERTRIEIRKGGKREPAWLKEPRSNMAGAGGVVHRDPGGKRCEGDKHNKSSFKNLSEDPDMPSPAEAFSS